MADYMKVLECEGGDIESARVKLKKRAAKY
jgi:hypothetical protein